MSARLLGLGLLLVAGCGSSGGGSTCQTPPTELAPESAALVAVDGEAFTYGDFTSGENNDCPSSEAGVDVVSVTIAGSQVDTGYPLVLCLPRPDLLVTGSLDLADPARVMVVDVSAQRSSDGCTFARQPGAVPSGTLSAAGYCTTAGSVWNLVLDGEVAGTRTCGAEATSVTLVLAGQVRVNSQ